MLSILNVAPNTAGPVPEFKTHSVIPLFAGTKAEKSTEGAFKGESTPNLEVEMIDSGLTSVFQTGRSTYSSLTVSNSLVIAVKFLARLRIS
jgi:hypothetical protein